MPTIALVDNDRNILTSVSIALEAEGHRINTYTDALSALDGFQTAPPDLAILDIKMPRMDGMEMLRRLRQKSDLPVIFLTSKDEEMDELTPRSKTLVSGCLAGAPSLGVARRLRMDPERHTCTWKNTPITLTGPEFLLLQALASRPGVVKSRNALMDAAYGEEVYVDDREIDSYIKRLHRLFLFPADVRMVYE